MLNYVILTTHSSHSQKKKNYSFFSSLFNVELHYTCNLTIFSSRVGLWLPVSFKTSSWAMNKLYSLPLTSWAFLFANTSSMGLHGSTPHIFYPSWEPHTSSLSNTISNNTLLLGLFQDHLCGLYGLAWCNILSPLQLWKGLTLLYLRKGFKYTHSIFAPTVKGTLITLPPLPHPKLN